MAALPALHGLVQPVLLIITMQRSKTLRSIVLQHYQRAMTGLAAVEFIQHGLENGLGRVGLAEERHAGAELEVVG